MTLAEFQQLVPAFETAFRTRMATTRFDGKPRTARRFTVYRSCPLPTPEERLLFGLVYLKTYTLQVVHGRLFGLGQSKANHWLHVLLPVLQTALTAVGDTPCRTLAALAERLGVPPEAAATLVPLPQPAPQQFPVGEKGQQNRGRGAGVLALCYPVRLRPLKSLT